MDILHLSTCGFFKDLVFFLEFFLCPFVKVMTFLWILRSIFQIAVSQKISFLHDFRMNDQWQVSKKIHKPDPKVSNEEQIFQKSRQKFDWKLIFLKVNGEFQNANLTRWRNAREPELKELIQTRLMFMWMIYFCSLAVANRW